ncbi:MAG: ParA family protein [Pseudomonadota bacterium]
MSDQIDKIFETHLKVVDDGYVKPGNLRYKNYAVTTLRGGVGKTTLSFNIAYEMSSKRSMLVADMCPQCNLTETLMRDENPVVTVLKALQPVLLGPAFGEKPEDLSYRISTTCSAFKTTKASYVVPGDAEMFAFPSTMYQQLQLAHSQNNQGAVKALLESLQRVLVAEAKEKKSSGILMDTSPFYAGGTHLAWCAADALIIPVRVDEHSIDSLELTLDMLLNPARDFCIWNERAGGRKPPKVAAVVMTMVGSKSRIRATPDRASRMYVERALSIAEKYPQAFDVKNPADVFVLTDDFVSSGRISGAKSIPISRLQIGGFHTVEGKRLQVNSSVTRYQRELAYLVSVL